MFYNKSKLNLNFQIKIKFFIFFLFESKLNLNFTQSTWHPSLDPIHQEHSQAKELEPNIKIKIKIY
jgi:hypothetical protein